MKAEFLKVCLNLASNSVCLDIPNVPDRVYEIVKDGLVSHCKVMFESVFEKEL